MRLAARPNLGFDAPLGLLETEASAVLHFGAGKDSIWKSCHEGSVVGFCSMKGNQDQG